jgi:hypothetical protein
MKNPQMQPSIQAVVSSVMSRWKLDVMEIDVGTVMPCNASYAVSVLFVVLVWRRWHPAAFVEPPPIKGFV